MPPADRPLVFTKCAFVWDQGGNLSICLRPESLRRAHRDHAAGRLDAAAFRAEQERSIREAVALQESLGFRAATDGEFRRVSYWSHFVAAVDGLAKILAPGGVLCAGVGAVPGTAPTAEVDRLSALYGVGSDLVLRNLPPVRIHRFCWTPGSPAVADRLVPVSRPSSVPLTSGMHIDSNGVAAAGILAGQPGGHPVGHHDDVAPDRLSRVELVADLAEVLVVGVDVLVVVDRDAGLFHEPVERGM